MSEKTETLLVHAGCGLVICLCFGLAELTPLSGVMLFGTPFFSRALEVFGFWLWGALGFKPAEVIMNRLIDNMLAAKSKPPGGAS